MYPDDIGKTVLCIKSGIVDVRTFAVNASPATIRKMMEHPNGILDGRKKIDVFGPARVDPAVPIEEILQALADLDRAGKICGIQLSDVKAEAIRRAAKVAKTGMVEAEGSLFSLSVDESINIKDIWDSFPIAGQRYPPATARLN